MNACQISGMQESALCPRTCGQMSTFLQPRNFRPSFCAMVSNIFFARFSANSFCGKKNMPTPYSLSPPMLIPSSEQTFLKNLCGIWVKIPTPSPVFPSASFPARCSRCSTMVRA